MQNNNPPEKNLYEKAIEVLQSCEKLRAYSDQQLINATRLKNEAVEIFQMALAQERKTKRRNYWTVVALIFTLLVLVIDNMKK